MSRIINRVRGIRGSFRPGQVITTPTRGTRGPAQLSDINTLASQLGAAGVGSGAAGNGVPSGGSDGQVLAKVAGAVAWTFTTAITAVGTIVTGVWHGTKIALAYGGTNADLSATGGAHSFLKQASSGAAITVAQVDYSDLSGTQPTNAITQLTGDVTVGPGSGSQAATLATVNSNVGTFGDATHSVTLTVNGKGLITAASQSAISAGGSGTVTSVSMTVPAELSVSGSPITTSGTLAVTWASEADNTLLSRIAGSSGVPSFNTLTAILDHALGNTNDKFAVRTSGSWTQGQISSYLTAGTGISLSGTTNVTISATGGSSADWDAYVQGGFGVGAFGSGGFGSLSLENANNGQLQTGAYRQVWKHLGAGTVPNWETLSTADLTDYSTWVTNTPTPTADSGTFTSASATQNVLVIGKIAHVIGSVTITTNGTAAGGVSVPMPTSVTWAGSVVAYGREAGLTGKMLIGSASGANMRFTNYDNTYPGGSGAVLVFEYFGAIA